MSQLSHVRTLIDYFILFSWFRHGLGRRPALHHLYGTAQEYPRGSIVVTRLAARFGVCVCAITVIDFHLIFTVAGGNCQRRTCCVTCPKCTWLCLFNRTFVFVVSDEYCEGEGVFLMIECKSYEHNIHILY